MLRFSTSAMCQEATLGASVPDRLRASGLGWYNTTVGLLGLVASVVAGLLWDHVGHAAVFLYGAVIGSIALLALLPAKQIRRAEQRLHMALRQQQRRIITAGRLAAIIPIHLVTRES
jgi:MFS family permease